MAERPIIFSAPMVRAILAGRKTQTRRILKLPKKTASGGPIYERPDMGGWEPTTVGGGGSFRLGARGERIAVPEQPAIWHRTTGVCMTLPFAVGDLLRVRESAHIDGAEVNYRADFPGNPKGLGWRPSIHMPRWASRITLKVTGVKVERLQDIGEEDAKAEGVESTLQRFPDGGHMGNTAAWHFSALWDQINGPGSWDANPWVAAISFERLPPPPAGERNG